MWIPNKDIKKKKVNLNKIIGILRILEKGDYHSWKRATELLWFFFLHIDLFVSNYVTQASGTLTWKIQFKPVLHILIRDKERHIIPDINYVTKAAGTKIHCTPDIHIVIRDKEIIPHIKIAI